ncbi:hypothetical protein AB4212_53810, partial [Streptomyces sp. 2MCAF27]
MAPPHGSPAPSARPRTRRARRIALALAAVGALLTTGPAALSHAAPAGPVENGTPKAAVQAAQLEK